MSGYRELLEKEMIEAWRTYRVGVVAGLFLVLGVVSPIITRYLPDIVRAFAPPGFIIDIPEVGVADVLDQLLKNVVQFGALAAILVTMGSVANEKERGTAAFVLAKPVSRLSFLAAKVVALGMIFALAIGLAVGGAWIYTRLLFEPVPLLPWIKLGFVVWLSTMVYVCVTFLGSTLTRTSLAAAGIGFFGLIVLSLASIAPGLNPWLPAGLTAVAKSLALSEPSPDLHPLRTIVVSAGLAGACLVVAWLRFRREEL
jgi:ABC-2 type transport system permease protein